jgi:rhamnosyltransferase
MRFLKSELRFMAGEAPWLLPETLARNGAKYLGYLLGRRFRQLPNRLRCRLSMTKVHWRSVLPAERERR